MTAHERARHLVGLWVGRDRPYCVNCRAMGYAARPGGFLQETCPADWNNTGTAAHLATLEEGITSLQSRLVKTSALHRLMA